MATSNLPVHVLCIGFTISPDLFTVLYLQVQVGKTSSITTSVANQQKKMTVDITLWIQFCIRMMCKDSWKPTSKTKGAGAQSCQLWFAHSPLQIHCLYSPCSDNRLSSVYMHLTIVLLLHDYLQVLFHSTSMIMNLEASSISYICIYKYGFDAPTFSFNCSLIKLCDGFEVAA